MANELRKVHGERHEMIEQLESLLEMMQKRDSEIQDFTEVWLVRSFVPSLTPANAAW